MPDPDLLNALLHSAGEVVDPAPDEVEKVPDDSFTEFFRFFWRIPKLALKFLAISLCLCPLLLYISIFAQGTGTGDIEPAAKIAELRDLRWADLLLPTACVFHWFYFRSRHENQTDIGKWKSRMYGRWIALALIAGIAVAMASILREQLILQTQK